VSSRARKAHAAYAWERLDDEALLSVRLRDLGLRIAGTPVEADALRVAEELTRRGIRFKPHVWLSTEWFSPDGVPGIAVPFYLAHPRLARLERRLMGQAEGGNRRWRMRLLRHEVGHAIDTAFGLRRRSDWRRVFGKASARYAQDYTARPRSKNYVLHLEHWYAQSHPTEDFAETFAVWLQPKARWRAEYAGWPALEKLEFVDGLMTELEGQRPPNRDRSVAEPVSERNRTLGEHYRRRAYLNRTGTQRYDATLKRVFPRRSSSSRDSSAERFLIGIKPTLIRAMLHRSRTHPYVVFQVLRAIRRRVRQLDLSVRGPKREAVQRAVRLHERILMDFLRRNEETFFL
jgi:Putative zinc-binding metallo-peptidase